MALADLDKVRLMVGDTDEADPLLYDSEIENFIELNKIEAEGETQTNIPAASADAAAAIAAKFARKFNFTTDGQSFELAQRVSHYTALSSDLRARSGGVSQPVTEAAE